MPESVLLQAQKELLNYRGIGASILEISHRSSVFKKVLEDTKNLARKLGNIPESHEILFLQGGSRFQFAMVAMNFISSDNSVTFVDSGHWTQTALKEFEIRGKVDILASSKQDGYRHVPEVDPEKASKDSSFLYLCSNNTIYGTQFSELPLSNSLPNVVDMCSDIFSRPIDFSKIDLAFASAQKNLGPAGVTMVIIRKEFAERGASDIQNYLQYRKHIEQDSLYNTAPTFGIYMLGLVLQWIEELGGLEAIEKRNQEKAKALYSTLEESEHFFCPIPEGSRSLMNVVFRARDESHEAQFLEEAEKKGFMGLKGHRAVGGLRASIYNAVEPTWVSELCGLIKDFRP